MGVRVPPGAQRPPSVRSTGGGSAFLPSTPSGVLFSCPSVCGVPSRPLSYSTRDEGGPAAGVPEWWCDRTRPAQSVPRLFREKLRPAHHKPPIVGHFSCAGRTFSRTGSCDVATLKPATPLQALMQANVKPPSPMLAPKQRPLKPPSPLRPKNTPTTPISHPQRRCRFQLRLSLREQRRWRFQLGGSKGDAGFRQPLRAQPHARSSENSHVIRLHKLSTTPRNIEIATITIQNLKRPQGNYVRN